eukprot:m.69741 g.69741  ORF g.69741 m.69741 type:complete len:454 (-) comp24134_c1_seq2:106-1467(-)
MSVLCISLFILGVSITTTTGSSSVVETTMATWHDSSEGIHAFLTFDSRATAENIAAYADRIDYVWGASSSHVAQWRNSSNPNVVLSYYIPFTRDPAPHTTGTPPTGLPWWIENHPELVLYQCDKKTPAWECFAGEGCAHVSVPLDLTNPATLEYQLSAAIVPAAKAGYNAIALDNYGLTNQWSACGSFSGPNGAWVQLYDATNPRDDKQYTQDVLDWTKRATERMHAIGLLVIPNFSEMNFDADTLIVANLTDGILAEAGFTIWDPVPNTSSMYTLPPFTTPEKFEAQVLFIRNLQQAGKGFFSINEWGPGPDYHLNPSCMPANITKSVRQFVVAAFMMTNTKSSGVFLTCIQCYGGGCGGLGNFSIWGPEWEAKVGTPQGEPSKDPLFGVWIRKYSDGIAFVNPSTHSVTLPLPTTSAWIDLYGEKQSDTITMAPASGLVLLKSPASHTSEQ